MRIDSRLPMVAILCAIQLASGCAESPNSEQAATTSDDPPANAQSAPLMTVNQLMHAILFPLGNTVFYSQSEDPAALAKDPMPSSSPNPLTGLYGGWQAVENSALALAESADLLLIEGRMCSNGEIVNVGDADWIRFVEDYREKSVAAYEAALTKNQDAMVDASGYLSESCLACHRVYRRGDPAGVDTTQRCIPGQPAASR